jgi:hypothetical protein
MLLEVSGLNRLKVVADDGPYRLIARDGPIGSVENLLYDARTWAIRCMVVDTRDWLPGKHVLVSPGWVDQVSWYEREVALNVDRDAVETSLEYARSAHVPRPHEAVTTTRRDPGRGF